VSEVIGFRRTRHQRSACRAAAARRARASPPVAPATCTRFRRPRLTSTRPTRA